MSNWYKEGYGDPECCLYRCYCGACGPQDDYVERVPVWTTRDGEKIPVTEMSQSHILNTIRVLTRTRDALRNWANRESEFEDIPFALWRDDREALARWTQWLVVFREELRRRERLSPAQQASMRAKWASRVFKVKR